MTEIRAQSRHVLLCSSEVAKRQATMSQSLSPISTGQDCHRRLPACVIMQMPQRYRISTTQVPLIGPGPPSCGRHRSCSSYSMQLVGNDMRTWRGQARLLSMSSRSHLLQHGARPPRSPTGDAGCAKLAFKLANARSVLYLEAVVPTLDMAKLHFCHIITIASFGNAGSKQAISTIRSAILPRLPGDQPVA